MRKLVAAVFGVVMVLGFMNSPAMAIQAFYNSLAKTYVEPAKDSALGKLIDKERCNVCHDPKNKKIRNEYGMAVSKLLKKADFGPDQLKADPEGKAKAIVEALKKVEADKASDGKTFGERMKEGKMPSAK